MALQYGYNITASDMRKLLEKNDKQQSGIRTWRQLFGNASLGANAQSGALTTDYSSAIAQAYTANQAQNNAIMNAGLNLGTTRDLISANRNNLHAAYDTYVRNYRENMNTVGSAYNSEVGAIDTALTQRAENFAKLYNSAYQYLTEELSALTKNGTGYLADEGLDWLADKEAGTVKSWELLSNELFNTDTSLTEKGRTFFDAMFNARPNDYIWADDETSRRAKSFDQWLSDKSLTDKSYEGLREWWAGQDEFNYTFSGSTAGTAKQMIGLESKDDAYTQREHTEFDDFAAFNSFENEIVNLQNVRNLEEQRRYAWAHNDTFSGNKMDAYKYLAEERPDDAVSGSEARKLEADATKAWSEYRTAINTQNTELMKTFKVSMGPALYEDFVVKNKALLDEYETLLDKVNSSEYYSESLIKQLTTAYARLINSMRKSLDAKSISGF